ncbi:hypothetical protein BX600DRAFT_512130 [Xylariales sp. PMI_506]|nr:hypothetical protein BX600DRAFT_512130 [Xylariales sp. PMI_506]
MHSILRLSVFGCVLGVANAKWFKRSSEAENWVPARPTYDVADLDPAGWSPKPTAAPGANLAEMELRKRAGTSTCGYYASYSSSAAIVCVNQASCVVNDGEQAMGCCTSANVADCLVATACIESSRASLYTASDLALTILCTSAAYPNCVTYSYDAADALYPGYSALGCGVVEAVYSVEYYPPVLGSAKTASTTRTSSKTSTSTTTSSSHSASTASTTSSTSTPTPTPASSGTAVGPIVGGVVGGVGGIALIAAAIFFFVRYSKRKKAADAPPPGPQTFPPNTYPPAPGGPPMGQAPPQFAPYGYAAVPVDNRESMAPSSYLGPSPTKGQFDGRNPAHISPSGSPAFHDPQYAYHQVPPPGQQYQYPISSQPGVYQQAHVAELPTSASDRELRELE